MANSDCGVRLGTGATVEEWLQLRTRNPEEATAILVTASHRAVPRWRGQSADREDSIQETVLRALMDDAGALRRADASTPLLGWLRACNRNVRREAARAQGRLPIGAGDEACALEEVCSTLLSPLEILAKEDEARHATDAVLRLASLLPKPYGHVLCWRQFRQMRWREVRSNLNACRPPGSRPILGRQARKFIGIAIEMLEQHRAGADFARIHRQKYLRSKNPWIGATLPPLRSQILMGAP